MIDKWKLIEITLEQLTRQWKHNKELFTTNSLDDHGESAFGESKNEPFISWAPPKMNHEEQQQFGLINKKVKITYNRKCGYFRCEISTVGALPSAKPDNLIIAYKKFVPIRKLYRDFISLRKSILRHQKIKESNEYLNDLYKVFPGTLDDLILGDRDDD